MQPL
ncbi:uncharacterized protein FFB20_15922 [Fusarium fujikuroi]|jgi:hypothetical protein